MRLYTVVLCVLLHGAGMGLLASVAEARTELHEIVAADMTEPAQWERVTDFGGGENSAVDDATPLTEEQQFRQKLYLELHPERAPKKAEAKIRFVEAGAEVTADAESESEADVEAEAETETEAQTEAEADTESDADAEADEAAAGAEDVEHVSAMEELRDDGSRANARYEMDAMLHSGFEVPRPAHTQPAVSLDAMRFQQIREAAAANTAAHQQQQAAVLTGEQMLAATWSADKQAALDAFLDATHDEDEDADEADDAEDADDEEHGDAEDEEFGASGMLELRAEHAHQRFGRGAAERLGMPRDHRTADADMDMGPPREFDADAEDTSDLEAAQAEVDAATGASPRAPARGAAHNMRFAGARAPLPKDPDSRLYYARTRRGDKIRRMIRRGDMLYRYAPELMSKVFDPARRVEKPGVTPRFAEAMDGPLGPITPPPPGGAAKPKKGSQGPAFFEMAEHAYTAQQNAAHAAAQTRDDEGSGGGEGGGEGGEGGDKSKPKKGSKEWIAKKMAEIDQLIKNPYAQAEKYPAMYQHWDNYMAPLRNRPLPPRWYPYPQKGRNPIASFPPAAALFENPAQRGPLQTPNALFQNPRGVAGLQPLPAPYAPIGQPSAPSPYQTPLGFSRFPGLGAGTGSDAANNGLLGPKNHAVYGIHPLPLQKWYQKFLPPAEAPAVAKPPGAKGGAEGGEGGSGGEGGGDE